MAFKRPTRTYDERSLYEYAVGALGRRMRSVAEIKRLMRTRVGRQENGNDLIEAVVTRLKDQKYLNDSSYATSYSGYRKDNEKFGRLRVVQELKARGIHGDVIEKAVGSTYEGVNEEKLARAYMLRKRLKKPTNQKETARVFRAMVRAGFGSRTIIAILKQWDVEEETLSALEQEATDHATTIPEDES